jgi:transcriptional regulator with XRE-family HTH domain
MSDIPTIGDVVRRWRQERFKLNLTDFAKHAGLSKGYLSAVERNRIKNPTDEKREMLAAAIGITDRELLARTMPEDLSDTNVLDETVPTSPEVEDDDFTFGSPLKTPQRDPDKTAQLRRLLAQVDELRETIVTLIAEKEQKHGRTKRP